MLWCYDGVVVDIVVVVVVVLVVVVVSFKFPYRCIYVLNIPGNKFDDTTGRYFEEALKVNHFRFCLVRGYDRYHRGPSRETTGIPFKPYLQNKTNPFYSLISEQCMLADGWQEQRYYEGQPKSPVTCKLGNQWISSTCMHQPKFYKPLEHIPSWQHTFLAASATTQEYVGTPKQDTAVGYCGCKN